MLEGKVAVITGGNQGLGKALCGALNEAGADVCSLDISEPVNNKDVQFYCCDVSNEQGCTKAIEQVIKQFGRIDILVNCAGVLIRDSIDSDTALVGYEKTMQVNVTGIVNMVRACLPALKVGGGSIVNIASIQSFIALSNSFAYNASKGAVLQLTKALAAELAPSDIRVNGIAPGWMETAMNKDDAKDDKAVEAFLQRVPLKRLGQAIDVGGPAVFLCSDMSKYVTGATIPVDGGFLAV